MACQYSASILPNILPISGQYNVYWPDIDPRLLRLYPANILPIQHVLATYWVPSIRAKLRCWAFQQWRGLPTTSSYGVIDLLAFIFRFQTSYKHPPILHMSGSKTNFFLTGATGTFIASSFLCIPFNYLRRLRRRLCSGSFPSASTRR
jgi:hypothetical protein